MKKNVFRISMLRQPVHTLLVMTLIIVTAFAFVTRAVEYITVTNTTESIGGHFRSIGYLRESGGNGKYDNVLEGANLVSQSPYVAFEDRRRVAEGVLRDMPNADIEGMPGMDIYGEGDTETAYTRHTDAFFYGEVISKERDDTKNDYLRPNIRMVVKVDDILTGYPEHITQGQEITLNYVLTEEEFDAELAAINNPPKKNDETSVSNAADDINIGMRYLFRGVFKAEYTDRMRPDGKGGLGLPQVGRNDGPLVLVPLNIDTSNLKRKLTGDPVWFIPVDQGELNDFETLEKEWFEEELLRLRHNQSAVWLHTTADMTAMPMMQSGQKMLRLTDGRWLDKDDNLNANPVAIVQEEFALWRGLKIGDTISVSVPQEQVGIDLQSLSFGTKESYDYVNVDEIWVSGIPEAEPNRILEFEIVGLYQIDSLFIRNDDPPFVDAFYSKMFTLVYIPDSVLPDDLTYSDVTISPLTRQTFSKYFGIELDDTVHLKDYLLHSRYSFVLNDARDEQAFVAENKDALAALGFDLRFFETSAQSFWNSAEPILQSAKFNFILFTIVLVLALALAMFLFLRQRRKEFAILRALGRSAKTSTGQLLSSVIFIGLTSSVIGGVAGWFFALNRASSTLNPFGEFATTFDVNIEMFSISMLWLPLLIAVVFALLMIMSAIGISKISKKPVIEALQGNEARKK